MDCSQPCQTSCGGLAFVVADERIEGRDVDGGNDVDGIQRSQCCLSKSAGRAEHRTVNREQRQRFEHLARSLEEDVKRQARID